MGERTNITRDKIQDIENRCKNKDCESVKPRLVCKNCIINKEYKKLVGISLNEV